MKSLISLALRYIPRKYLQLFSHWIAKLLSVFYLGNKVSCNVCDHHYRKFLPYGRKARENALCPHCLSLERHRMMWLFLKDKTDFFQAKLKILHIAPELCFIKRFEVEGCSPCVIQNRQNVFLFRNCSNRWNILKFESIRAWRL